MAYTDMGDFLKDYCKQMHINAMPTAVVKRLLDDHKKGLLNDVQESWITKYFEERDGKLVRKDLPTIDSDYISDAELQKVYDAFAIAMSGMKTASALYDNIKDANAKSFVKEYFDTKQVFQTPQATEDTEKGIKKIVDFLQNGSPEASKLKNDLLLNVKKDAPKADENLFATPGDIDKLLTKCQNEEYNRNTTVQNKIQKVARYLLGELSTYSYGEDPSKEALSKIRSYLEVVSNADAFSNISMPSGMSLEIFGKEHLPALLQRLYDEKDIRAKFAEKDDKDILGKGINKAEKLAWNDPKSEDYVKPKYDDTLTPLQQLEKRAGDTYNDTLKKYEELRGAHLFSSPHAKEICKAIDKLKIKPADGLPKLLEKANDIKGKIDNGHTAQHFDWFVETMNEVKDAIPKSIEGCWQDADQMRCVVEKIILKATEPGKTDEDMRKAETAMEIMTVMKYGMMTSKVMDAMRQSDFKIFSDGDLSWNKNEGIQFVTKAFDKSVKDAFLGVGYGITFLKNKFKLRKINFTEEHNKSGLLADRLDELNKNKAQDDATRDAMLEANERDLTGAGGINENQAIVDSLEAGYDTDKTVKEAKEAELNRISKEIAEKNKEIQNIEEEKAPLEQEYQELSQRKQNYDSAEDILANGDLDREKADLDKRKHNNDMHIGAKKTELMADPLLDPDGNPILDEDLKEARKKQLAQEISQLYSEKTDIKSSLDQNMQDRNPATMSDERRAKRSDAEATKTEYETKYQAKHDDTKRELDTKNARIEALKSEINDLNLRRQAINTDRSYTEARDRVNRYDDATKRIKELTKIREERETALSTWDQDHVNKVLYLENYWNMLNSGESKTWGLFTSNAQDKFDDSKDMRMRRLLYNAQRGIVE